MRHPLLTIASCVQGGVIALLASPAPAQVPNTLLYTIPAPPTGTIVLGEAHFGQSVSVDGGIVVVGAPLNDVAGTDSGVVRVFDSTTGAPLFVLPNPSPAALDSFGYSVAISGTRLVVGAPNDNTGAPDAGSAYVYDLGSATPAVPVATLNNPDPADLDHFGYSVAISGTRVVVGIPHDNTGAADAGRAYVYDVGSGTPTVPVATLGNPGPGANDVFGFSVAIAGTRVVVGARGDDTGAPDSGSAYVYDLSVGAPGAPVVTLNNPNPRPGDPFRPLFGSSVAISGALVVVGDPADTTGAIGAGSAYVYDLSGALPAVPVTTLSNPSPATDDLFGSSVAISGTRITVGAIWDDTGAPDAGSAYLYDVASATPTLPVATLHNPTPAADDRFGVAVALFGTRLCVGAPSDDAGAPNAGGAYVYDFGSATPTAPVATLNNTSPAAEDRFGSVVAISGSRVVVGCSADDTGAVNAGSVYVYDLSSTAPMLPVATLHNPSPAVDDRFGSSLAIEGTRLVVGASSDDTGASGAGSAYVYDLSAATPLLPVLTLHNPRPAAGGGGFGYAVAISGLRVAVGAPFDDTAGSNSGSVYVYALNSNTPTSPVHTLDNLIPYTVDNFGISVGLVGTRVMASSTGDYQGTVFVYELATAIPTVISLRASEDDFGHPAAISGTRVAVGTTYPWSEKAFVYDLSSGSPRDPVADLPNPRRLPDSFGSSIAISGERVAVGAPGAGAVYLYDLIGGTPSVPAATLSKPAGGFGSAVALSGQRMVVGAPSDSSVAPNKGSVSIFGPAPPKFTVHSLPSHTTIPAGGSQSFGEVFVASSVSLTFILKNIGPTSLTGLGTTIDGVNAADFTVTTSPVAPVSSPDGTTSFTVEFSPSTPGAKAAILHIAGNGPDDGPFDLNLAGTGLPPVNGPVAQGSPVSFSVEAAGAASVQWAKDGVDIPGAVGMTLAIPAAQPWHIGVYSARLTTGTSSSTKVVGVLELTDVPPGLWRGLVACYPFNGGPEDMCRPGKPVSLVNTSEMAADPQRGGVAHLTGKGWAIPPLPGEPVELQGPGGYLQIPRPPLVDGEPFTVSFVMKEEGFSLRHGESLFTMGEGAVPTDLLAHYWVGGLDGFPEIYAGPTEAVWDHNSDIVVNGSAVSLNAPWTGYALVADGNLLRLYRNGQLMGTTSYKKDTLGDSFMGRHWWENGARYSTRLVAKVDDLRFYNRALTAPEVQQLYSLVQTTPPLHSFESWVLIHGLSGTDAGRAGDPDRDRLSNWDEYSFGTSPTDQTESLMKARFAGSTLTLEWLEIAGVRYDLKETSTLLAPWTPAAAIPVLPADQSGVPAGYKRTQATIPIPPAGSAVGNRFFRVEATKNP